MAENVKLTYDNLEKLLNERTAQLEMTHKMLHKITKERDNTIKFNNELRRQNELLNAKLHVHQNVINMLTSTVGTQTDYDNQIDQKCCLCSNKSSKCIVANDAVESDNSWKAKADKSNTRIADLVREAAEDITKLNDYVYDDKSNTYYSRSSGWYFYPDRSLFYDPHTKNYYSYDSEKKCYNFYSSLNSNGKRGIETEFSKKKRLKVPKFPLINNNDETIDISSSEEEGQIESSSDECGGNDSDGGNDPENNDDSIDWGPPCVRMIVNESSTLELGSLLLITCMGAMIGNDSKCDVWITDESVCKNHAEIKYDKNLNHYVLKDLSSINGTFRNGNKIDGDICEIRHCDEIRFGDCKLLIHIHDGRDVTCDKCEPGLVQANIKKVDDSHINVSYDKEKERKKFKKLLKKKYGLADADYCVPKITVPQSYTDRAEQRRVTKGSDNPHEKTAAGSSLDTPLTETNKGYKMLEKMGWCNGEGLGKTRIGNTEPMTIKPEVRNKIPSLLCLKINMPYPKDRFSDNK